MRWGEWRVIETAGGRASGERRSRRHRGLLALLALLVIVAAGRAGAFEVSETGFPIPVLDSRFYPAPVAWVDLTDAIEGRETLVEKFLNLSEQAHTYVGFSAFSIAGAVFAYLVNDKTTVEGQVSYGFMLLDSDGDGIFERKYAASESAEVPQWVIDRALKLMEQPKEPR